MAKTLDFNKINRPHLRVVMTDEAQTVIRVAVPTEELVRELDAALPAMKELMATPTPEATAASYDLTARIMSCNLDDIKVTVDDLRGKYGFNLERLFMFNAAYKGFINEINNEKN